MPRDYNKVKAEVIKLLGDLEDTVWELGYHLDEHETYLARTFFSSQLRLFRTWMVARKEHGSSDAPGEAPEDSPAVAEVGGHTGGDESSV